MGERKAGREEGVKGKKVGRCERQERRKKGKK
jgi:hypothetical protein